MKYEAKIIGGPILITPNIDTALDWIMSYLRKNLDITIELYLDGEKISTFSRRSDA